MMAGCFQDTNDRERAGFNAGRATNTHLGLEGIRMVRGFKEEHHTRNRKNRVDAFWANFILATPQQDGYVQ